MCREVVRMLKLLKSNRDMSINEVKLTIAIEDPRARERRESLGIEVSCEETLLLDRSVDSGPYFCPIRVL